MTDDRDHRRRHDPLHTDPEIDILDPDDLTPPLRKRHKTPVYEPSVQVDPSAFEPDTRWREFDQMRDEVKLCAEDRKRSARIKRWLFVTIVPSAGGILGLLVWAVTKLDARAEAAAEERLRQQMLQRHDVEIRVLQLQQAAAAALLGLRAQP